MTKPEKKVVVINEDLEYDPEEQLVLFVFKDENDKFLDARLVSTPLHRQDMEDLISEYNLYCVKNDICVICPDKTICSMCPNNIFDVDDFLEYTGTFCDTAEVIDSGIIVYNSIKVNTTKGV